MAEVTDKLHVVEIIFQGCFCFQQSIFEPMLTSTRYAQDATFCRHVAISIS